MGALVAHPASYSPSSSLIHTLLHHHPFTAVDTNLQLIKSGSLLSTITHAAFFFVQLLGDLPSSPFSLTSCVPSCRLLQAEPFLGTHSYTTHATCWESAESFLPHGSSPQVLPLLPAHLDKSQLLTIYRAGVINYPTLDGLQALTSNCC